MIRHETTLIVAGPDLQEEAHLKALFVLGRSDAAVGRRPGCSARTSTGRRRR